MRVRHLRVVLTQMHAKLFWKPGLLDSYLVLVDESSQLFGSQRLASGQQVGYWAHLAELPVLCVCGSIRVAAGTVRHDCHRPNNSSTGGGLLSVIHAVQPQVKAVLSTHI